MSRILTMRDGSAGFLLAHMALWFHENVEKLDVGDWDDWGYARRVIRGGSAWSNHASGTAMDLNATRHPLGRPTLESFSRKEVRAIHVRLRLYHGCIFWGGDWLHRPDSMHFELARGLQACEQRAQALCRTNRGVRVLKANDGAEKVIFS